MVAYRLVIGWVGRAPVRELDKLVAVFELSEKFTSLRDPSAAITWARELMGVSKKFLTPKVLATLVSRSIRNGSRIPKTFISCAPFSRTGLPARIS
jgi:ParB family chromosome partitioning protein